MIYATRRERIEAEKRQRHGRQMRTLKAGMASFAALAGVTVAGVVPAHADYTVKSGDTLYDIAAKHENVTVSGLMQTNGLSSSLIYPGQNLSFSSNSSSSNSSASAASNAVHTVVSGDTLSHIALQHGTTVSALMSENGLSSTLIFPGDRLTIPGGSDAAPAAASSANTSASSSAASAPARSSAANSGTSSAATSSNTQASSSTSTNAAPRSQANSAPAASGSASSSSGISAASSSPSLTRTSGTSAASTSGVSWAISTANSPTASYRLGANGAGNQWDCSSFAQRALSQDGKSIPRDTHSQWAAAQKISKGQLQPGDLVFFGHGSPTHVAVYVGNGQIAHARNPNAGLSVNGLDSYAQYNNVVGYGRF